jgi:hypothetical protein
LTAEPAIEKITVMTTRSTSQWEWRRRRSAVLLMAIIFVGCARGSFAQTDAKDRTDKPAQTRLPGDQPRVGESPAANSGAAAAQSNEPDMMKAMMELSQKNENHRLLSSLDGNWEYTLRFWMDPDPNAKPQESKGNATRKSIMDGRYVMMDVTGSMQMPGADGKLQNVPFKGMGIEGYDNVKKKFVAAWVDSMGTGIEFSEGTYDSATKSFTYTFEMEPIPGTKTRTREVVKLTDNDHMVLDWYEDHGSGERKTMEINYTRKK